jgi:L-asparaginase/beta-aspartyl-peptidase (threonine type)
MWSVAIHGGAGAVGRAPQDEQERDLESTLAWAEGVLMGGAAALDVVEGAVRRMEDSGRFVAGRGARPNLAGQYELDAAIMDGRTQASGAVAALEGAYPPISIARAVMERTGHVLLAGDGARRFALGQGFAAIDDPAAFFATRFNARGEARPTLADGDPHGTVGAVALDLSGAIAAATSTGGTDRKLPGRVGDSPIAGAGCWADRLVGVSSTGKGEFFIRTAAAHEVAMRMRLTGAALTEALAASLADVARIGGDGGMIAVDAAGAVAYVFNSHAMRFAMANAAGLREVAVKLRTGATG